jgi:Glycosyltransferase family 9 (heptosyltransferase)
MNAGDEWISALSRGDHETAWRISASILAASDPSKRDDPSLPYHLRWVWDGRPFRGRHVLVRCYHGFGDTIQFARYLPPLRAVAASVTLEVAPKLLPLFEGFPGIDKTVAFDPDAPAPPSECDIEIMELPFALRKRPDCIPLPYLRAEPAPLPAGTIGLCWRAGKWDQRRSLPPELFDPLTRYPCVTLVAKPTTLDVLNPEGCPNQIMPTAELIAGVDLVITVDTMIAHLAGALGRPTWLLLRRHPDWRWRQGTAETPWYPSMRLYRQSNEGEWGDVIARVREDLDRWQRGRDRCSQAGAAALELDS